VFGFLIVHLRCPLSALSARMESSQDAIVCFVDKMGLKLVALGPQIRDSDGKNLLIETARSGKFNLDVLAGVIEKCEAAGANNVTLEIALKAKSDLVQTANNVLQLRSQIEQIASGLLDAKEYAEVGKFVQFKKSIQDVVCTSAGVSHMSFVVQSTLSDDECKLLEQYKLHQSSQARFKEMQTSARQWSVAAAVGTVGGIGIVALGAAVLCPATVAVGTVARVACEASAWWQLAESRECGKHAKSAEDMASMAHAMSSAVDVYQNMWSAVGIGTMELAEGLDDLHRLNPKRQAQFASKVTQVAKSLKILVEALDEFAVWLSLCKYFPPNYPLADKIGAKRYRAMRAALMDA